MERKFWKKPKFWRVTALLIILAVCLVQLRHKRRLESALVDDGPELAAGPFAAAAEYLVFPDETLYLPGFFRSLPSVIAAVPARPE